MIKYKYAFFDMDGTIGDTSEGIFACTKYAFQKLGAPLDESYESLRRVIGPPLEFAYEEYFGLNPEDSKKAVALYRERYSVKGIYEMRLYDGVEKALKALKDNGVILAVVSAKPQEYIEKIVKHFDLEQYFSLNVGAAFGDNDTSKVHLINRALVHFKIVDKSEVVMIGDRMYDLDSAAELGIDGIGASYGYGDIAELNASPNVFIGNTAEEICKFIISDLSE